MGFLEKIGLTQRAPGVGLTAAATVLEMDDATEQARIRRGAEQWQRDSWNAFDDLAEISYPANYQANALSRIRLVPAVQVDPREPPTPLDPDGEDELELTDAERAAMYATLARLGSGPLPLSEIQRLIAINQFIAGDGYLVGYEHDGGEMWDFLSVEELVLDQNGRGYARRLANTGITGQESLPEDAFIARLYQRHPRFSAWAYSSMRSVLQLCDELRILTDAIRATATSRIPAGILFLNRKMLAGPKDQTLTGQRDEAANDPTVQALLEHIETPIKNRRSASAISPFLWFLDTDDVNKEVKLVEIGREIDKLYGEQRKELSRRIGVGLDLPPEVLTGLGDVKYWNAQMIDQSTFKYHLEPDAQLMVQSLSTGYYQPHLMKMGLEGVNRFVIWYDPSPLFSHPNRTQDMTNAYDRIEASGDALRRALEIPETDAPSDEERAERTWAKLVEKMQTAPVVMPTPEQIMRGNFEEAPTGASTATEDPSAPAAGTPTTPPETGPAQAAMDLPPIRALTASAAIGPLGPRLANIEAALRLRLLQAADDAMQRTLEKAGNKLRSLANKTAALRTEVGNQVRDVDPLEVAGILGPERVAALATSADDLLAGSFTGLGASWTTWVRRAQEQALAGIDDHGDLDEADAERITGQMTAHREEGWSVFEGALLALAATMLYDPHKAPPEQGEWADFTLPVGTVREALDEAGGGPIDGDIPGGLLGGKTIDEALEAADLTVTAWVWRHGDPVREFPPHANLNGVEFADYSDEALANDGDWPDTPFYFPEDHEGCSCYAEAVIEGVAGPDADEGVTE